MTIAVGDRVGARGALDGEPRGFEHAPVACHVGCAPLEQVADPVEAERRLARLKDGERQVDAFGREEGAPADRPYALERTERIAEVQEQRSADHHVELADLHGRQVIDAQRPSLDGGAEEPVRNPEPEALLAPGQLLHHGGSAPLGEERRAVPGLVGADIDRDDLCGSATLELEREKAIPRPDVEAPLASDIRPGQRADDRTQIEPAGRHHARSHVDRVVPQRNGGDLGGRIGVFAQGVLHRGLQHRRRARQGFHAHRTAASSLCFAGPAE